MTPERQAIIEMLKAAVARTKRKQWWFEHKSGVMHSYHKGSGAVDRNNTLGKGIEL